MRLLIQHVASEAGIRDLRVTGSRIEALARGLAPRRRERVVDGRGLFALPGLINAHDHLSLNLLPHLGTPPYPNVYAFADDVYRPEAAPITPIQTLTRPIDRLLWGAYKNLISGVTTVAHHDPFTRRVFDGWGTRWRYPVKVVRRYAWSHSLRFGPAPAAAFRRDRPFIIHAAEGVDAGAGAEIDRLDALGVLAPNTVLVHAIAVDSGQRRRLVEAGVGIVWCPFSNQRLYGRTADVSALCAAGVPVALGTDSTISGSPTLLDEVRSAAQTGLSTPRQILAMVTDRAARLFALGDGRGHLVAGGPADLILVPEHGSGPADALLTATPSSLALVLIDGSPRLADTERAQDVGVGPANVWIDGEEKWLYGEIAGLRRRLARTAGEGALENGILWQRIVPRSTAEDRDDDAHDPTTAPAASRAR